MNNPEKSTRPSSRPIGGMITSSTSDETVFPKAAPIITPTAKSMTLPRMANSLNSFSMDVLLYFFLLMTLDGLGGFPNSERPVFCGDYSRSRRERKTRRRSARDLPPRPFGRRFFSAAERARTRQSNRAAPADHHRPPVVDQPRGTV